MKADLFDFAACKRMPRYDGKGGWVGRQRPPSRPDERGALAVVDCVFGGRVALLPISSVPDWVRVVTLP